MKIKSNKIKCKKCLICDDIVDNKTSKDGYCKKCQSNIEKAKKELGEFWKSYLEDNGTINKNKLILELCDYQFLMEQASKVYCEITGGILSKTYYTAEVILSYYDSNLQKILEDYTENDFILDILNDDSLSDKEKLNEILTLLGGTKVLLERKKLVEDFKKMNKGID
jgi:hypothetical protein